MKAFQIVSSLLCVLYCWKVKGNPCEDSNIKDLTAADRRIQYYATTDKCDNSDPEIDSWSSWYRVFGQAGNALWAVQEPPLNRCGTKRRVYLKERHPTTSEGTVTKRLCVAFEDGSPCHRDKNIQVINCGEFYLYKLTKISYHCGVNRQWRYCTNGNVESPCLTGSCPVGQRCVLTNNGYNKSCINDDPCAANPCANNGTCVAGSGGYTCSCPAGLTGDRCQTNLPASPCSSNPCQNDGNCIVNSGGSSGYSCTCPSEFTGNRCQTNLTGNACFNNSAGVSDPNIIRDYQMTASSQLDRARLSRYGRLNTKRGFCWCARSNVGNDEWLQVDLGKTFEICGVATQGDRNGISWATTFKLSYSGNGSTPWTTYLDTDGSEMEFHRSGGAHIADKHYLPVPVSTRYVRFNPTNRHFWNCLRVEVYGIAYDPCSPSPCLNNGTCVPTSVTSYKCSCLPNFTGLNCSSLIPPVDGNWSSWFPWPSCNKPCNSGTKTRKRLCNNPEPAYGGKDCEGPATESESCNPQICPADVLNYEVKLTAKSWRGGFANKGSQLYELVEGQIVNDVKGFYSQGSQDVGVEILQFRQGSVIVSFNVSYMAIDSLQIVSLQEYIEAGGKLADSPTELLSVTSSNVPGEAPVIQNATSPTSTTIEIKWTEATQLHAATLQGYGIVYKKINENFQVAFLKSVQPTPREATLEDMEKFTKYTIRVFAFTSNGNGISSQPVSLMTQEDVPSASPPNTVVQSTSSSTIDVSWDPMNRAHVHGILLGYEVRFTKDDGSPPSWKTKTLDPNTHKITLSDLEYFTEYKVVVCAKTSKGCGKKYSAISYTWGDVPDKPPRSLTALNLTSEENIPVNWSPVPYGHVKGLLKGYSIKYQRLRTAERAVSDADEETLIVEPNKLSTFLKVETYSTYMIKIAAFTQRGMGPYSKYVYAESCRCPKVLFTNYWSTTPYLKVNEKDDKLEGLFSGIVTEMVHAACGFCPAYGDTKIDLKTNGKRSRAAKRGVLEVLADIDDVPQITFPLYGNPYMTKYMGDKAYINLVESPGIAFIATARSPGQAALNMIIAVLSTAPLMVMSACFAFISGFIIWLLDSKHNPDEFPPSFMKGVSEGFWWSFISMTTVGYGDRAPKTIPARIFGIIWTLTGLVIISILIGAIATSLTSVTVQKDIILYGAKIGAIQNSTEYRLGILKNAKVNTERKYSNLEEIRAALEDGEIDGALVDTYVAAENKGTLLDDRVFVKQILDRPFGYGVVLSGAARNVEQRCRDYIDLHISEIFKVIVNKTKTLDPSDGGIKDSTGLFDSQSEMFLLTTASLLGLLFLAVVAGLAYQYLIFVPRRDRDIKLEASSSEFAYKETLVKEMKELVESFYSKMSSKISLIMELKKREMAEMKETVKDSEKHKKSGDNCKESSENIYASEPAYSSIEEPGDSSRRLVHCASAKSILQQCQEWPLPSPASLNKAADTTSIDNASPSMSSNDRPVSASDVIYEDN